MQVFHILKEVESGMPVVNVAWEHEVSPATIHRWKSKYAGMTLSEFKRLKALGEENARLKRIVAQQTLGNELQREIIVNRKNPYNCPFPDRGSWGGLLETPLSPSFPHQGRDILYKVMRVTKS